MSETCDETNKTQFITDVEATHATRADAHELPEIQKRLEESEKKPQEQYADAGFVNGQTILSSQSDGIKLEGPSAGRSQSFEKYEAEDWPLDMADFEVKKDTVTTDICCDCLQCKEIYSTRHPLWIRGGGTNSRFSFFFFCQMVF